MGQTPTISQSRLPFSQTTASLFAKLLGLAEQGSLPDWAVRVGIRRLLRKRLKELRTQNSADAIQGLLDNVADQQIAVATEEANEQHYELPSEFFEHVLGPQRKYSCCYWQPGTPDLAQAEENALRITAEHAGLQDGMDILELGCGWGSFSLWMAKQFPLSQITAISNSHAQRRYITNQVKRFGLTNLNVVTADINHFQPRLDSQADSGFDRVVSIEMFEHMRNHQKLIRRIDDWLRPDGKLFVHIFCHQTTPYLFDTEGDQNWMGRYFFTGGMMPSADWLGHCSGRLNLSDRWTWNGTHYAKTCRAWLRNQDTASEYLMPILSRTYGREHTQLWWSRWRIFFMACEELFAFNRGDEWYVNHYLFER